MSNATKSNATKNTTRTNPIPHADFTLRATQSQRESTNDALRSGDASEIEIFGASLPFEGKMHDVVSVVLDTDEAAIEYVIKDAGRRLGGFTPTRAHTFSVNGLYRLTAKRRFNVSHDTLVMVLNPYCGTIDDEDGNPLPVERRVSYDGQDYTLYFEEANCVRVSPCSARVEGFATWDSETTIGQLFFRFGREKSSSVNVCARHDAKSADPFARCTPSAHEKSAAAKSDLHVSAREITVQRFAVECNLCGDDMVCDERTLIAFASRHADCK